MQGPWIKNRPEIVDQLRRIVKKKNTQEIKGENQITLLGCKKEIKAGRRFKI